MLFFQIFNPCLGFHLGVFKVGAFWLSALNAFTIRENLDVKAIILQATGSRHFQDQGQKLWSFGITPLTTQKLCFISYTQSSWCFNHCFSAKAPGGPEIRARDCEPLLILGLGSVGPNARA